MLRKVPVLALLFVANVVFFFPPQTGQAQGLRPEELTNSDVLDLLKAGLPSEVVVAKIKMSRCTFDTSPAVLKELKAEGVPDAVILAMVQAPKDDLETPDETHSRKPVTQEETGYVKCGRGGTAINLLASPQGDLATGPGLACGEKVTILGFSEGFYKVRTLTGSEGYISHYFLNATNSRWENKSTAYSNTGDSAYSLPSTRVPNRKALGSGLPSGTVRSLAYRVIPQQTTSYYRSGGYSSQTSCYGSGTWTTFGNFGSMNLSTDCDTTYSTPTDIPITWRYVDVYNVVETDSYHYLIHCRANWRWSKCSALIPGQVFEVEVKGSTAWISGMRDGKKQARVKYSILQMSPK